MNYKILHHDEAVSDVRSAIAADIYLTSNITNKCYGERIALGHAVFRFSTNPHEVTLINVQRVESYR